VRLHERTADKAALDIELGQALAADPGRKPGR
jgi:hypothetical protein